VAKGDELSRVLRPGQRKDVLQLRKGVLQPVHHAACSVASLEGIPAIRANHLDYVMRIVRRRQDNTQRSVRFIAICVDSRTVR
jgi:hypothetical protein